MHQTSNVDPMEGALNRLFSTIEMLSSKIDELNERVDYLGSFVGLEVQDEENKVPVEPPGQLAGLSFDKLNKILSPKDANDLRAYFLRVLSLFRRYIKSIVVFGSAKTKTGITSTSDIDVAFIVDDTDIQRFTLEQLKERLFVKMAEIARDFSEKIHAQAYPLAEFWGSIVRPNPVILTLLRDGEVIYDTGFFYPLQMLYKSGLITPTRESIDANIANAETLLLWADDTLSKKLTRDLFDSAVAAGQALLMEYGYLPPVPKEVGKHLMSVAVEKEKVLTKDDVERLEEIIRWGKRIEHGELKSVSGQEYAEKYNRTKEAVDKVLKVISTLREKKGLPKPIIEQDLAKLTGQVQQQQQQEKYVPKPQEHKI